MRCRHSILSYLMLGDEQMRNAWLFSLPDEQMKNVLGVEHQPDMDVFGQIANQLIFYGAFFSYKPRFIPCMLWYVPIYLPSKKKTVLYVKND